MKTKKKFEMGFFALIGLIAITVLSGAQMNDTKYSEFAMGGKEKLVTEAFNSGVAEIKFAESVKNRTSTPEVKELATMMIADHSNLNGKLKALAANEKIILNYELSTSQQKDLENLQAKSGNDLDMAYVGLLKDSHKELVDLYEKGSKCSDDQISAFFSEALPKIKNHQDRIAKLSEKLNKDSKIGSMNN